jgi:hypothetical protein
VVNAITDEVIRIEPTADQGHLPFRAPLRDRPRLFPWAAFGDARNPSTQSAQLSTAIPTRSRVGKRPSLFTNVVVNAITDEVIRIEPTADQGHLPFRAPLRDRPRLFPWAAFGDARNPSTQSAQLSTAIPTRSRVGKRPLTFVR